MPDILTDGDSDFYAGDIHYASILSLSEVSLLIKHLVVRQPLLEVLTDNRTVVDNAGRVK